MRFKKKEVVYFISTSAFDEYKTLCKDYIDNVYDDHITTFFYEAELSFSSFGKSWELNRNVLHDKYGKLFCVDEDLHIMDKNKEVIKRTHLQKMNMVKETVYIILRDKLNRIAIMVKDYVWKVKKEGIETFFYERILPFNQFGDSWEFDRRYLEEKYGHIHCREEDKPLIFGYTERDFVQSVYDNIQDIKNKIGKDSVGYYDLDSLGFNIANRLEAIDLEIESSDKTLR